VEAPHLGNGMVQAGQVRFCRSSRGLTNVIGGRRHQDTHHRVPDGLWLSVPGRANLGRVAFAGVISSAAPLDHQTGGSRPSPGGSAGRTQQTKLRSVAQNPSNEVRRRRRSSHPAFLVLFQNIPLELTCRALSNAGSVGYSGPVRQPTADHRKRARISHLRVDDRLNTRDSGYG